MIKTFSPKPVFSVGPILSETFWAPQTHPAPSENDGRFVQFLDEKQAKFGERSVVYVSLIPDVRDNVPINMSRSRLEPYSGRQR